MLESLAHAQARGAHMYGEVLGYGIASDTATRYSGGVATSGMKRAMETALAHTTDETGNGHVGTGRPQGISRSEAPVRSPQHQPVIWANAAGYHPADIAEERAIKHLFGPTSATKVVSPKKYLGEPVGAGSLINTALALTAWQNRKQETALINSCSLGGTHFSILLASIDD